MKITTHITVDIDPTTVIERLWEEYDQALCSSVLTTEERAKGRAVISTDDKIIMQEYGYGPQDPVKSREIRALSEEEKEMQKCFEKVLDFAAVYASMKL